MSNSLDNVFQGIYKSIVEEGRKVKDAPQVYKGGGAVTELPKGYREGGRVRLI